MKVIRNRILPIGKRYLAINLFGVVFAKGEMDAVDLNHERIHTAQMRELLYIPFYILYFIEWLVRIVQHRGSLFAAYRAISFEREAYAHQRELSYLSSRSRFAWLNYL